MACGPLNSFIKPIINRIEATSPSSVSCQEKILAINKKYSMSKSETTQSRIIIFFELKALTHVNEKQGLVTGNKLNLM